MDVSVAGTIPTLIIPTSFIKEGSPPSRPHLIGLFKNYLDEFENNAGMLFHKVAAVVINFGAICLLTRVDAKLLLFFRDVSPFTVQGGVQELHHTQSNARRKQSLQKKMLCDSPINNLVKLRGGGSENNGIEENPDYDDGDNSNHDEDDVETNIENASSNENGDDEADESSVLENQLNYDRLIVDKSILNSSGSSSSSSSSSRTRRQRTNLTTIHKSSKSNKKYYSVNKHFINFVRRHRIHFYILLTVFAFRTEIFDLLVCQLRLIPTVLDPITLKRKIHIKWSTDVLKLVLILEVIRKYFLPTYSLVETENSSTPLENGDDEEVIENNEEKKLNSTQALKSKPSTNYSLSNRFRYHRVLPLLIIVSSLLLLPRNLSYFILPMCLRILLAGASGTSPDPDSPLGNVLLLLLFGRTGSHSSDLSKRMAYLPPLEQHYAFEQLNERYFRDWGAYRKAFDTHPIVSAAAAAAAAHANTLGNGGQLSSDNTSRTFRTGRTLASLISQMTPPSTSSGTTKILSNPPPAYPTEYKNGTVIVLDMTKLDTQASRMESIRDQINFITHYLAFICENEDSSSFYKDQRKDELINGTHASAPNVSSNNETDFGRASNTTQLILTAAAQEPAIEVIVLLESPGGGVSQYGLAASHLHRLRSNPNIKLTICVDSVAASGGYMMACMSSPGQLYCAPFAMVGSIGVIGQSLNVQKTLEGYGVRPYVFRGGKMKNPVGMVGDVTKEGILAMQLMVDRIHDAFRDHVASARKEAFVEALRSGAIPKQTRKYFQPTSDSDDDDQKLNTQFIMDQVATGDVFLGVQAIHIGLVDRLITSDEYISERIRHGARVLKLVNHHKSTGLLSLLGTASPHHLSKVSNLLLESKRLIHNMFQHGACSHFFL